MKIKSKEFVNYVRIFASVILAWAFNKVAGLTLCRDKTVTIISLGFASYFYLKGLTFVYEGLKDDREKTELGMRD